jgi:hypothetical protein
VFLERLEPRVFLSCDVSASDGTLFIDGDDNANVVRIVDEGFGSVTVLCDGLPSDLLSEPPADQSSEPLRFTGIVTIELKVAGGDDQVYYETLPGASQPAALLADLGDGENMADVRYVGGGNPDPSGRQLVLTAGAGSDNVVVSVDNSFDVFFDLNLGDGENTADVRCIGGGQPDPGELQLILTGGAGSDRVHLTEALAANVAQTIHAELGRRIPA